MIEGGTPSALAQRCNMCWQEANGPCFRTQCGHLFCESCAFQHFGQSQSCPACGHSLEEADISDLTIGLAPAHFRRMMFQEIYKEPDFRSVGQSVVRAAMALHESVAFVLAQMTIEGQRAAESDVQLKTDLAKQRHENGRLTMQLRNQSASVEQKLREADHKLRLREKELVDLQEAYKEKSRKCQAWEKAYGNLRSQMDRGRGGGGFTPPESPRGGAALRGPSGVPTPPQQQQLSPRERAAGGGGISSMQRSDDRAPADSSHPSLRGGTFMGRDESYRGASNNNGSSSNTNGARAPWPLARPTASRGGAAGSDNHVSPMLRPRKGQGFSHSVTPSPTFPAQQTASGRFATKRPETPVEVRGYYSRNRSPGNRVGGGAGAGGIDGAITSGAAGAFFPPQKSNGLF